MTDSINSIRCGLWFQRIEEVVDVESTPVTPSIKNKPSPAPRGLQRNRRRSMNSEMHDEDEDVRLYKRVRLLQKKYRHKLKPPENVSRVKKGIESTNSRLQNALIFELSNPDRDWSVRNLPPPSLGYGTSPYSSRNDGSEYDPESAIWQSGEVFTPTSSYMGFQSDDNPPSDCQPRFGIFEKSPTWRLPSSNEMRSGKYSYAWYVHKFFYRTSLEESHVWQSRTGPAMQLLEARYGNIFLSNE